MGNKLAVTAALAALALGALFENSDKTASIKPAAAQNTLRGEHFPASGTMKPGAEWNSGTSPFANVRVHAPVAPPPAPIIVTPPPPPAPSVIVVTPPPV